MAREIIEAVYRIKGEDAGAKKALEDIGNAADDTGEELEEMGVAGFMALQQMEQKLEATWNKLTGFWKDISAGVKSTTADLDKLAKTSRQLDIDPNVFRGLGFALEREGGNAETMTRSLEILAARMDDVKNGSADAVRDFKAMGVEVQNADGSFKQLDQVLFDIADSMATMGTAAEKNAIARGILSRAGGEFVNMLSKGSEGMRELIKESERYHGSVTQQQLQAAEELADAMTNLNAAIKGLTEAGLAELIKAAKPLVQDLADLATSTRKWVEEHPGIVKVGEAVGGVGLAVATLVIGVGLAAIKIRLAIASIRTEMTALGITTDGVRGKISTMGTTAKGALGGTAGAMVAGAVIAPMAVMEGSGILDEYRWARKAKFAESDIDEVNRIMVRHTIARTIGRATGARYFGYGDQTLEERLAAEGIQARETYMRDGRQYVVPLQIEGSVELKGATTANVSADVTGLM